MFKLKFRTRRELRRFGWGCLAWSLGGAGLPLLFTLDGAQAEASTCVLMGLFALCLYAAGTWVSQGIASGYADAPKLGNMRSAVALLYVLCVLLGPALLGRLAWELWREHRAAAAAPWERGDE